METKKTKFLNKIRQRVGQSEVGRKWLQSVTSSRALAFVGSSLSQAASNYPYIVFPNNSSGLAIASNGQDASCLLAGQQLIVPDFFFSFSVNYSSAVSFGLSNQPLQSGSYPSQSFSSVMTGQQALMFHNDGSYYFNGTAIGKWCDLTLNSNGFGYSFPSGSTITFYFTNNVFFYQVANKTPVSIMTNLTSSCYLNVLYNSLYSNSIVMTATPQNPPSASGYPSILTANGLSSSIYPVLTDSNYEIWISNQLLTLPYSFSAIFMSANAEGFLGLTTSYTKNGAKRTSLVQLYSDNTLIFTSSGKLSFGGALLNNIDPYFSSGDTVTFSEAGSTLSYSRNGLAPFVLASPLPTGNRYLCCGRNRSQSLSYVMTASPSAPTAATNFPSLIFPNGKSVQNLLGADTVLVCYASNQPLGTGFSYAFTVTSLTGTSIYFGITDNFTVNGNKGAGLTNVLTTGTSAMCDLTGNGTLNGVTALSTSLTFAVGDLVSLTEVGSLIYVRKNSGSAVAFASSATFGANRYFVLAFNPSTVTGSLTQASAPATLTYPNVYLPSNVLTRTYPLAASPYMPYVSSQNITNNYSFTFQTSNISGAQAVAGIYIYDVVPSPANPSTMPPASSYYGLVLYQSGTTSYFSKNGAMTGVTTTVASGDKIGFREIGNGFEFNKNGGTWSVVGTSSASTARYLVVFMGSINNLTITMTA